MVDAKTPILPRWPFLLGDAAMLGLAWFIYWQGKLPLSVGELTAGITCVALGALLAVMPYLLEHRTALKALEAVALEGAAAKLQQVGEVATRIEAATHHWQFAQEQAEKTANVARELADQMAEETKSFTKSMEGLNDREKGALRLEVEKLRRAENDWLNVLVHILDHVYALHLAAERSGQPSLTSQISTFQNVCRDASRRVGLVPFAATSREPFDPKRHQSAGGQTPEEGTPIIETLATGFTFQGRMIRPALVRLPAENPPPGVMENPPESATLQSDGAEPTQLELDSERQPA